MRRLFLSLLTSLIACSAKPNIIWIFSDDHAHAAISAYQGRFAEIAPTPNIDRIAKEGMLFKRSYVSNSICAPARACILTGQHSGKNGVLTNKHTLDYEKVTTFPHLLQDAGYQTALIGKWHLKVNPEGFDHWAVLPGQGKYYDVEFYEPAENEEGRKIVKYPGKHSTKMIMDKSLAYLEGAKGADKPFLLMCQFKAPHRNWLPSPENVDAFEGVTFPEPSTLHDTYETRGTAAHEQGLNLKRSMNMGKDLKVSKGHDLQKLAELSHPAHIDFYEKRTQDWLKNTLRKNEELVEWKYQAYMQDYLACIKGVDQQVGRLPDWLEANGLAENTLVAYSSDQGFYLGEHGWFDKRFMYEETFGTPLLVRYPPMIQAGEENTDLVQNIDMAPTFLDLAGVEAPEDMDGVSLLPLLKSETPQDWRDHLYYHYYEYPGGHSIRRHEGVSDKRYKLIRFYGEDVPNAEEWEFYDIQEDPHELKNLITSTEHEEEISRLKEILKTYQ